MSTNKKQPNKMKTKNFLIASIVGGITNFLLGWLFYGIAFADFFPQPEETPNTLPLIFMGCMTFGFLLSYIYMKWAQITTAATGAKTGIIIGFLMGLYFNFFNMTMSSSATIQMFIIDVAISMVMTAIVGAVIGALNGKLK